MKRFLWLGLLLASPRVAAGGQIALTFDDLPYQTKKGGDPLEPSPEVWQQTNAAILAALAGAGAPATIFVNCANLAKDDTLLASWRDAGHAIGNHTAHHMSATSGSVDEWSADVRACDGLWVVDSTEPRWFRFPYLWRGETIERRDAVLGLLEASQYVPVPVTVDSNDWIFEFARHRSAAQPDAQATRTALGQWLTSSVGEAVAEARQVAADKLEREIPHILLLHINQITADQLPHILADLAQAGLEVVPLHQVMADPLYAEPDAWAGKGARMWLERTAPLTRPDGTPWYSSRQAILMEDAQKIVDGTMP